MASELRECIECGASCERDFCSPQCQDLWELGPAKPPGWCLVDIPINHNIAKGESKAKSWSPR